jgi:hypothetical protein
MTRMHDPKLISMDGVLGRNGGWGGIWYKVGLGVHKAGYDGVAFLGRHGSQDLGQGNGSSLQRGRVCWIC